MIKRVAVIVAFLVLTAGVAWASDESEYKVVMTKNDRLCSYMLDVLNKDLRTYGRGYDRDKFQDSVFQAISWAELGKDFNYSGKVARFDINNDGQVDFVIRQQTSGLKSVTFDRLFIFDQSQAIASIKTVRDLYEKSVGMVEFGLQKGYDFKGLPPLTHDSGLLKGKQYYEGLGWAVYIYPFIIDQTTYLLMKRSFDSGPDPSWLLIAKYKTGRVQSANPEFMEDICYMK